MSTNYMVSDKIRKAHYSSSIVIRVARCEHMQVNGDLMYHLHIVYSERGL